MKNQTDLFAGASVQKGGGGRLIRLQQVPQTNYRGSGPVLARSDEHATLRKCLRFCIRPLTEEQIEVLEAR
jgi:hypothetical protein